MTPSNIEEEKRIACSIKQNREHVETAVLSTDERVIARVTDGIYRQPGSALRELISNAYDADASKVVIRTDEPRFNTMTIEDNGHGMSPESLSYVIHHIGGSAKRSEVGASSGVTHPENYNLSPNGRHLIGKIGIGLFSVAQLTQSFQIITKRKGDDFRSVATVILNQFSDGSKKDNTTDDKYKSGVVNLWTETATDLEYHGTTIVLNKIRPQTRETLKSKQIWDSVFSSRQEFEENGALPISPPKFHIGVMENNDYLANVEGSERSIPWLNSDKPHIAFQKLVRCVWDASTVGTPNPRVSELFDYYLKMIWDLSLSIPTKYVEGDVFDLPFNNQFYPYMLSNSTKGQASKIDMSIGQTLSQQISLLKDDDQFDVLIDNLKLSRPIIYDNLPILSQNQVNKPMIFIGKFEESFEGKPIEFTSGPLKFHAYLFWNSKICPVEHQGSLIRIHNASGTLFDETFMRYQVQELTRKRQVTCEIFIEEGFDSALNIDRESYNFSHPHVVILTRWLHNAFRQLTNANKQLAQKIRSESKEFKRTIISSQLNDIVEKAWKKAGNDESQNLPTISFIDDVSKSSPKSDFVFNLTSRKKNGEKNHNIRKSSIKSPSDILSEEKIRAITTILASYGVLDFIPENKRNEMIYSIYEVIVAES